MHLTCITAVDVERLERTFAVLTEDGWVVPAWLERLRWLTRAEPLPPPSGCTWRYRHGWQRAEHDLRNFDALGFTDGHAAEVGDPFTLDDTWRGYRDRFAFAREALC